VTLPRGIYSLPPGNSLAVQLYVAVHPQDWDCDQYVADRAASVTLHLQVGGGLVCAGRGCMTLIIHPHMM
jgi:hypothetical protein